MQLRVVGDIQFGGSIRPRVFVMPRMMSKLEVTGGLSKCKIPSDILTSSPSQRP